MSNNTETLSPTPGMLYFLHALSAVHMGTGSSTGGIDLPLAREVATDWPYVPGTGVKGVLRDGGSTTDHNWLFGPAWGQPNDRDQGALMFSDARLLCLPVRSYTGGWAWVTSGAALQAYQREAKWCGVSSLPTALPMAVTDSEAALVAHDPCPLKLGARLILHDVLFKNCPLDAELTSWAAHIAKLVFDNEREQGAFQKRLILVSETAFAYLGKVGMDLRTRNRLEANKKVADTGPWTEENLPVETIVWGTVTADTLEKTDGMKPAADAVNRFKSMRQSGSRIQVGGKATVGRGVVRWCTAS